MFITSGLFISIKHYKYYKLLSNILINLANAHEDDFWEENLYMNSSKNLNKMIKVSLLVAISVVLMYFDFPIIGDMIKIPVSGETRSFFKDVKE